MTQSREDPTLIQLYELIKTEELLHGFLKKYRLTAAPPALGWTKGKDPKPFVGHCNAIPFNPNKPNCTGVITEVMKNGCPKFRCTMCKSEKSAYHGPSCYNPQINRPGMTIFNSVDSLMRPNRKISPRDILYMTFCIAHEIPPSRLSILTSSNLSKETLVNWGNIIREMTAHELFAFPKMGGVGDIIEIDESYMKGRRKANRGRLMARNLAGHRGHRRNNYMARAQGPWLLGLICRRTKEVRMVYVPDRTAATLIPIIKRHVAVGSIIMSDEWRAYTSLPQYGYHHQKVNHSSHFVDPITGASTQLIERQWKKIKLQLLKQDPGVALSTIRSHLSRYWWLSINGRHACHDPFFRYIEMIAKHMVL